MFVGQASAYKRAIQPAQNARVQSLLNIVLTAAVLAALWHIKETIMATQAELAQSLRDLKAQNDKASTEQAAALKKLQDALDAAGATSPEVDAALADLKASIQADDDQNPDAPTEPTEPPAA